jgi:hypothetical protein
MKRSVVIKQLGYEAPAALDNLRYIFLRRLLLNARSACSQQLVKLRQ